MPKAVTVPCSCPGTPHGSDSVTLADKLSLPGAVAAFSALPSSGTSLDVIQGLVTPAYFRFGITDWTFTDERGEPLPLTVENIDERLAWDTGGFEVADAAHGLYTGDLLAPLARRLQERSRTTSTDDSTSPTPQPGSDTPTSSASSSPVKRAGKRHAAPAS